MVVAIVALVVAASGTAVAASRLVNGDSLIKRDSLSGNRLRNATVTGRKIKLSSLGEVPSAKTAANAQELGGRPASAYALGGSGGGSSSTVVKTGLVTASGGQTVKMSSFGPFTVSLTCNDDGSGTFDAEVDVVSTTSNSEVFGSQLTAGTSQEIADTIPDSQFYDNGGSVEDFVAPPDVYEVYVVDSIFMPGTTTPCAASLLAAKS
jgi:hypothetical protein